MLAVMVVITASSVFLVVLASGTLQLEEDIDRKDLVSWLVDQGLYSKDGAIALDDVDDDMGGLDLQQGISGMTLTYRCSGSSTPLVVLEQGEPATGDVLGFQLPLLIDLGGRNVSGVLEVRAWR